MKKVLIADDHSLFTTGFAALLKDRGFEVVGEVSNGSDVLYKISSLVPDLLILDLNLPKQNGLDVLKAIRESNQKIAVLVLTMYSDEFLANEVKRLGGNAYFLKNSDQKELISVMSTLTVSDFYLTKSMQEVMRPEGLKEDEFPGSIRLTKREREILKYLVDGKSSKDIGDILEISFATVDTHRKNMLKKLSLNKISELVSYAHRNHLV